MNRKREWPAKVVVRGAYYGCDTGCDGFEVAEDDGIEDRIDWSFYAIDSEAEAREHWEIPDHVVVRFIPGRLEC